MRPIIDVFTRQYCEACEKAKAQINASNPSSHGVTLNIHDVDAEQSGLKIVPVVIIGDTTIEGYKSAEIDQALSSLYSSLTPEVKDETPPDPQPDPPVVDDLPPAPIVTDQPYASSPGGVSRPLVVGVFALLGFFIGTRFVKY